MVRNPKERTPKGIHRPDTNVVYPDGDVLLRGQHASAVARFRLYQDGVEEVNCGLDEGLPGLVRDGPPAAVPKPGEFGRASWLYKDLSGVSNALSHQFAKNHLSVAAGLAWVPERVRADFDDPADALAVLDIRVLFHEEEDIQFSFLEN